MLIEERTQRTVLTSVLSDPWEDRKTRRETSTAFPTEKASQAAGPTVKGGCWGLNW